MNITKEIQVVKTVIDETKIKKGYKVLYKGRNFYDERNKDFWEHECDGEVMTVGDDYIVIHDLDYPEYAYEISVEDLASGMFYSIEIIE